MRPTAEGWYFAKQLAMSWPDGTEEKFTTIEIECVQVCVEGFDPHGNEILKVFIVGEEVTQPITNFEWISQIYMPGPPRLVREDC